MSKALVTKGQVSNIHSLIHKLSHLVIQEEGIVKLNLDFINPLWLGLMPWLSWCARWWCHGMLSFITFPDTKARLTGCASPHPPACPSRKWVWHLFTSGQFSPVSQVNDWKWLGKLLHSSLSSLGCTHGCVPGLMDSTVGAQLNKSVTFCVGFLLLPGKVVRSLGPFLHLLCQLLCILSLGITRAKWHLLQVSEHLATFASNPSSQHLLPCELKVSGGSLSSPWGPPSLGNLPKHHSRTFHSGSHQHWSHSPWNRVLLLVIPWLNLLLGLLEPPVHCVQVPVEPGAWLWLSSWHGMMFSVPLPILLCGHSTFSSILLSAWGCLCPLDWQDAAQHQRWAATEIVPGAVWGARVRQVCPQCLGRSPLQAVSAPENMGIFTRGKMIVFYRNGPMFLSKGHEPLEGHRSIQKGREILDRRNQQQLSSSREAKWESAVSIGCQCLPQQGNC